MLLNVCGSTEAVVVEGGKMSHLIELSPNLKEIFRFKGLEGREDEIALNLLAAGLKEFLRECEDEILEFEIKYGLSFEKFIEELNSGKLGTPHSYPLEKDAMRWEDLVSEKQIRLESLRRLERLS